MRDSIRTRLTVAFIGLALGPLLLAGFVVAWQTFSTGIQHAFTLQHEVARRVSAQVTAFFEEIEDSLRLVSQVQGLQTLDREKQESVLSELLMYKDVFEELVLLDSRGQTRIHLARLNTTPTGREDWAQTDAFLIPRAGARIYYGTVRFDATTGESLMIIALPLVDVRSGQVDGVLSSSVRFKKIWDLIAGIQVSPGQSVYMVDAQGKVVAHRNPSVVLRGTRFNVPDRDGIQSGLDGSGVVLAVETIRLGQQEMHVVAEQATSEALAPGIRALYLTAALVAMMLVLSSTLGVLMVRQIVQPVEMMATTARTINAGDLSQRVPITRHDELGVLGEAFNDMTGRLSAVITDLERQIAERKRAEESLKKANETLQALIDHSPLAIVVFDLAGHVLLWNGAAEKMYDWTTQEVAGIFLPSIPEEKLEEFRALRDRVVQGESITSLEVERRRKDGSIFPLEESIAPLRDAAGKVYAQMIIGVDITGRKLAEKEHSKLEEQLRQAQKLESIGQLAGGIAHDFNNLLLPILGYTELAQMELAAESKLYVDLEKIKTSAGQAAGLTRQLLAFSRRQVLEVRVFDLNEIVTEFKEMLRRLLKEDIELQVCLAATPCLVKADWTQIQQMLLNLSINARDAMPNGGKLIIETDCIVLDEAYARVHLDTQPGRYVMLSISDTGCGMDSETQKHIFEPFFTTKEKGRGTGLGLAMVFGIVKQHRGNIWVYSEPGKGTTFKIYLPKSDETAQPVAAAISDPTSAHGTETVLVVEDEHMVRKLVCETLEAHGYAVIEAENPENGLRFASTYEGTIHMLLTDVIMPGMNGRELYEKLVIARPALKVLYMSGYTDDVIVHHGVLEEGVNLLQKPFTIRLLTQKVRKALD